MFMDEFIPKFISVDIPFFVWQIVFASVSFLVVFNTRRKDIHHFSLQMTPDDINSIHDVSPLTINDYLISYTYTICIVLICFQVQT